MAQNNKILTKTACFTDIHFGAKSNSELHNKDCIRYIEWFCEQVKKDADIDNIIFMGDWYENRSALNVMTLNYSYRGAKLLNSLNVPIFFVIGNHDLYHRHTRELYSPITMGEFDNFKLIDAPIVVKELGTGALLSPYLFGEEYPSLHEYLNLDTWWGHFEFKGFVVTGYNVIMPTGPDPNDYVGPKRIFSGHFHKRQTQKHVHYIGNTFPTNFGDAGDNDRGMMVYDHQTDTINYINWPNCPKYVKTKLTDILDETAKVHIGARVKCVVDVPISFEESTFLRQSFIEKYNLREFVMEESKEIADVITNTETNINPEDIKLDSVDDLVIQMLSGIESDHIDKNVLIEQYRRIRT